MGLRVPIFKLTTVIGITGAFGKMKATSSNLPLLRKFSAIGILPFIPAKRLQELGFLEYQPAPLR